MIGTDARPGELFSGYMNETEKSQPLQAAILSEELATIRNRTRKWPQWLDTDEAAVLRWLERSNA